MGEKDLMMRSLPVRAQSAYDEAHDLRAAVREAAGIQRLIRHHLQRIARRPVDGASPRDAERTRQVMAYLLQTLERNTRALQRAPAMRSNRPVLH